MASMPDKKFLTLTFFVIFFVNFANTQVFDATNNVKTIASGSNCKCKCTLTTNEGKPCSNNPEQRRIVFMIDTVSKGENCQCSCIAPPYPDSCQAALSYGNNYGAGKSRPLVLVPIFKDSIGNSIALSLSRSLFEDFPAEFNVSDIARKTLENINTIKAYSIATKLKAVLDNIQQLLNENHVNEEDALEENINKVIDARQTTTTAVGNLDQDNIRQSATTSSLSTATDDRLDNALLDQSTAPFPTNFVSAITDATSSPSNFSKDPNLGNVEERNEVTKEFQTKVKHVSDETKLFSTVSVLSLDPTKSNTLSPSTTTEYAQTALQNNSESTTTQHLTLRATTPKLLNIFKIHNFTYSKVASGTIELYRKQDPSVVKKTKEKTEEYYDENYYDYEAEDPDTIVQPALKNLGSSPSDKTDPTLTLTPTTSSPEKDYNELYEEYYEGYGLETTTTITQPSATQLHIFQPKANECGTLLNLSIPQTVHNFGRREGAWLRDFGGKTENRNKIYVTNSYYGNRLIEFTSMTNFKDFRWSKSYILPYHWIGTGHIVYNGSFYFNRAFSRNLIKYDLTYRFVTAWGHLPEAIYDTSSPYSRRGHITMHMGADENGLWAIYPVYNDGSIDPNSEIYFINKIDPTDLRVIKNWKAAFKRHSVSHIFVVCGVVYATDRHDRHRSRITYAYDTYTSVRRRLNLPFKNLYSYNVQLLYDPGQKELLSWDNGHQIIYNVNFSY